MVNTSSKIKSNLYCLQSTNPLYIFSAMVFNATFNNISVISWWSVLLVEETGVPVKIPKASANQLHNIMLNREHLAMIGFELTTSVVIGTDCMGSCKNNYYTIKTTTGPNFF